MPRQSACLATVFAAGCLCALAHAQTFPPGFVSELIASRHDIHGPTCAAVAPDGRIFIASRFGDLHVWTPDRGVLATPFHTFTVTPPTDRGIIGVALDPDFANNGVVYAQIFRSFRTNEIFRLTADNANPDVADPASVTLIRSLTASPGGSLVEAAMQFGPDGKLYIGLPDNGVNGDAQSLTAVDGKVLRFNSDGSIPDDNPFYNDTTGVCRAIWALGLRKPNAFAFQPGTGRLFINDSNDSWQEINEAAAGDNFGWPVTDGDFDPVQFPDLTRPFLAYPPDVGRFITAAVFYHPPTPSFPADYTGDFFFADRNGNWIKRLDPVTGVVHDFLPRHLSVVDLDVDAQGRLLLLTPLQLMRVSYCPADFNADAVVDSDDVFDYLDEFFRSRPRADFNADSVINSQDFFDYLTAFFHGC